METIRVVTDASSSHVRRSQGRYPGLHIVESRDRLSPCGLGRSPFLRAALTCFLVAAGVAVLAVLIA